MTRGQVGYEAYAAHTGGKTFDGRDMPTWEAVADRTKAAWEAAASAIAGEDEPQNRQAADMREMDGES